MLIDRRKEIISCLVQIIHYSYKNFLEYTVDIGRCCQIHHFSKNLVSIRWSCSIIYRIPYLYKQNIKSIKEKEFSIVIYHETATSTSSLIPLINLIINCIIS